MSIAYRPQADPRAPLDAEAVRATYRQSGGRGIERTYGWTADVVAIIRSAETIRTVNHQHATVSSG